jgi:hypothetical protein
MKSIVTEHNVDDLIGICNLAPDAPEMNLPLKEKIKFVNAVVTSIAAKKATFRKGTCFANVVGSSNDPKIDHSSWRKLWEATVNNNQKTKFCTSIDYPPKSFPPETKDCQKRLINFVGGHVVKGKTSKIVAAGDSKSVFILPICSRHNKKDHIYMKATRYRVAVLLEKFGKPK